MFLDESLFDLDSAGDYDRRIKMVAFSVAIVKDSYQTVLLRVTLERSEIRRSPIRSLPRESELGNLPMSTWPRSLREGRREHLGQDA